MPEAALVRLRVLEEDVGVAVPEAHVHVAAVAGQVREGLRHEGRDQPPLLRHRLDHVAIEDRSIGAGEGISGAPVLLELAVGVLVIGGVEPPAQRVDVVGDLGDEIEAPGQRADVVAGLLEVVELVGDLDAAVLGLSHEQVLELVADLELVAHVLAALHLVSQDRSRAIRPRLTLDDDVRGEPAHVSASRAAA